MIVVDAQCWVWTPHGMQRSMHADNGYISIRDVEQLLEEAHRRGRDSSLRDCTQCGETHRGPCRDTGEP